MLTDVIAALSTPPGRSAIAVVRVSGPGALEVAARVLGNGQPAATLETRRPTLATIRGGDGAALDQALVTVYRAPHSYTGEDLAEFSCHGGLLAPAQVLAALYEAGARPARPGEFTRRAVLNGKLDLLQAEAIGDLIDATATGQARAALFQLEGGLSRRLEHLREEIVELQALLAYDIDFPEEDDGPVPRDRIRGMVERVLESVNQLLATAPLGERLREGALIVLAGRPNAGKSSLFNALLGTNRALVTEIPGTTRDTIEANSEVEGWPVRLADTAGLRDADERLERMGIEVSRRYVSSADLLLLCVESGRQPTTEEHAILADHPALLVRTKADLVPESARKGEEGIPVSTVTAEGLEQLRGEVAERLFRGPQGYADLTPMLTRERHRIALTRAHEALAAAGCEVGTGEGKGDPVLAAHQVREAITALDELIGVVHPEEVLARVFERFCIGK
ncbi:MAG: tRNA uridine-5-carboxymethylaminomethyl(34) synthesis GTPase MnmE [Gemmatimonadales bacterium]